MDTLLLAYACGILVSAFVFGAVKAFDPFVDERYLPVLAISWPIIAAAWAGVAVGTLLAKVVNR